MDTKSKYAPSVAHLRNIKATPSSKEAAYQFGYQIFVEGTRTHEQLNEVSLAEYTPTEVMQFMRGWATAKSDEKY